MYGFDSMNNWKITEDVPGSIGFAEAETTTEETTTTTTEKPKPVYDHLKRTKSSLN